MKQLYENTKLLILNNYDGEFDEEVLDILTISIMSLFIRFSEITQEKLPTILKRLKIFFDNKTILQMVTERYPEYPKDEITEKSDAFVIRALDFDDEGKIDEEWSMYISTSDMSNGVVNIIAKSTHELIHLLRFNGIIDGEKEIEIRDGVSAAICNKKTMALKRKHYNLEEGIVEYFTIESLISLYELIKNEEVSFSPALTSFKRNFQRDFKPAYEVIRFFLDGLNRSKEFSELLEYSFSDKNQPLSLIRYYNDVVGNPNAFATLSQLLDTIVGYMETGDIKNLERETTRLIKQINEFLRKDVKKKIT